ARDVAETIDRLFASGRYADIQVDVENSGAGVAVRFLTEPERFVGNVSFLDKVGAPPTSGQVLSAAELELGSRFDDDMLAASAGKVRELLRGNGYFDAKVTVQTGPNIEHQQVNLVIAADSGKRARYEQPDIQGDTKLPDSTIVKATGWQVKFIG